MMIRLLLVFSFLILGACSGSSDAPGGTTGIEDGVNKKLPVNETYFRIDDETKARDLISSQGQSFAVQGRVMRLSQMTTLGKPQSNMNATHCSFTSLGGFPINLYSGKNFKVVEVNQRHEKRAMNEVNVLEVTTDEQGLSILCTKKASLGQITFSEAQATLTGILSFY